MKRSLPFFLFFIYFLPAQAQIVTLHDEFSGCIEKIAIDEDNDVLWMGTSLSDGGDLFMRDAQGDRTDLSELTSEINFQSITALWMDESTLYAGGFGGIAIIDPDAEEYTLFTTSNSNYSNSNVPSTLVFDYNTDKLYAGSFSSSTDVLEEDGWTVDNTLNRVLASTFDYEEDQLLLATSNGELISITEEDKTVFNSNNSDLPNLSYTDITVDSEGNMYLLAYENGFVHFDGENATHYTPQNSDLFGGDLNSIDVDLNGKVWFGHNGGITSFKNGTFETFVLENAVGFWPIINDIVVDNENHLWLAACGGLIEFALDPTDTEDISSSETLIFPNPNSGNFTFEASEKGQLHLYNNMGALVQTNAIQVGKNEIQTLVPSGIYTYSFKGIRHTSSDKICIY